EEYDRAPGEAGLELGAEASDPREEPIDLLDPVIQGPKKGFLRGGDPAREDLLRIGHAQMLAQERRDVPGIVKAVVAVLLIHRLLVLPTLLEVLELLPLQLLVSLDDELLEHPLVVGVLEELNDVL